MSRLILIAGAPRSGTSMLAGLLVRHGVSLGRPTAPPDASNGKGSFESAAMKAIMKDVLAENGHRRELAMPVGDWPEALASVPCWRDRVLTVWDGPTDVARGLPKWRWAVKESRVLNTWPLWREAFPGAFYVLPRRDVTDTARSMYKHPGVSRNGDLDALTQWAEMCRRRQDDIAEAHEDAHVFVDTHAMACGSLDEAKMFVEACGLDFKADATRDWIDRSLWHA